MDEVLNHLEAAELLANSVTLLCAVYVTFATAGNTIGWGRTAASITAFSVNVVIQVWFLVLWGAHIKKGCTETDLWTTRSMKGSMAPSNTDFTPSEEGECPKPSNVKGHGRAHPMEIEVVANPLSEHDAAVVRI